MDTTMPRLERGHTPALDVSTAWRIVLAGAVATAAFDFFGQSLSPIAGFSALAPVALANNVIQTLFGEGYRPGAYLLHSWQPDRPEGIRSLTLSSGDAKTLRLR